MAAIETLGDLMGRGRIATIEEGSNLFCGFGVNGVATVRPTRPQWLARRLNRRDDDTFQRVVKISLSEPVDDRAIPHLAQLKSLEEIDIFACDLSDEGKARLRDLFPNATIDFDAGKKWLEKIRAQLRSDGLPTPQPSTSAAP